MVRVALPLLLLLPAASLAPDDVLVTTAPLDGLVRCLRDRLAPNGRVTAINTAGGTMLDYAFDTVGADGKVATSRLAFTVDDHGSERAMAVRAVSTADAALAHQYLREAGGRCVADGEKIAAQGAR